MDFRFRPIAIIGFAGRFPGADSMDQLLDLLAAGKDCVGPISALRLKDTTLPPDKDYIKGGFLSDVDKFDYKFFNYAPIEAISMDPHIRIAIENTYHCLEDSGYGPDFFRGTDTIVVASASNLYYFQHADEFDPTLLTGNDLPFLSASISRQFGLRGQSTVTHSSCSSGLSALQIACDALSLGRSEYAIVIGSNITLFPDKVSIGIGLDSQEGRSRSFSSKADGMSNGEVSISLLLKPLDKALQDDDNIHAVIRAIGSNNDADLSATLTSPVHTSQVNLLEKVWSMANITPRDIGYVEAHGSGTQLGDSMEVLALNTTFGAYTNDRHFCSLSTIKTNIGHAKNASGLAGLAKVVLSLKSGKLFPSLHFEEPSHLIDFDNSAVKVQTVLEDWDSSGKRLAGLTCMGMSGTNFHAIVEEAPIQIGRTNRWDGPFLIVISGPSQDTLASKVKHMKEVDLSKIEIADVASTLLSGRAHFSFRRVALVKDKSELLKSLEGERKHVGKPDKGTRLIFLSVQGAVPDSKAAEYLSNRYPIFEKDFQYCLNAAQDRDNVFVIELAMQYSFFNLLKAAGITTETIIAIGTGELLLKVVNNTMTIESALNLAADTRMPSMEDVAQRTGKMLEKVTANDFPLFIDLGLCSVISEQLRKLERVNDSFAIVRTTEISDPLLQCMAAWYEAGQNLNWQFAGGIFDGRRISLPLYPFEKTRCWIRESPKLQSAANMGAAESVADFGDGLGEVELDILNLWKEILNTQVTSLEESFFELGGNSLKATKMIVRLNEKYDADLSFEDIFEFQSIAKLSGYIKEQVGTAFCLKMIWKKVLKLDSVEEDDNFFDLGGHSLLANNLINGVNREFKVRLNFEDVFHAPELGALARIIEKLKTDKRDGLGKIDIAKAGSNYPLSIFQERMLASIKSDPAKSISYNEPMTFWFDGVLDQAALLYSLTCLQHRHEILRTKFEVEQDGTVRQRVLTTKEYNFEMDYQDAIDIADNLLDSYLRECIDEYSETSFNAIGGQLWKVQLIKVREDRHLFSLVLHGLITDGWSKGIIMREFLTFYSSYLNPAVGKLTPLRIQFKDFAVWQRESENTDKSRSYWLHRFEGNPAPVVFPIDFLADIPEKRADNVASLMLDTALSSRFRELTFQEEATLFMGALALLNTALYKFTGHRDIVIGTPIANRLHSDLEGQLGPYANTLALRTTFDGRESFRGLLSQVRVRTLEAYNFQEYPFQELVASLVPSAGLDDSPLFEIMLVFHNTESYTQSDLQQIGDLSIRGYQSRSKYKLKHAMVFDFFEVDGAIKIVLSYDAALYHRETTEAILSYFNELILQIVRNADQSISLLPGPVSYEENHV
jgi:3-oxoacyl-(acyl-carrier-protein) synthase/acyl carrier protein